MEINPWTGLVAPVHLCIVISNNNSNKDLGWTEFMLGLLPQRGNWFALKLTTIMSCTNNEEEIFFAWIKPKPELCLRFSFWLVIYIGSKTIKEQIWSCWFIYIGIYRQKQGRPYLFNWHTGMLKTRIIQKNYYQSQNQKNGKWQLIFRWRCVVAH